MKLVEDSYNILPDGSLVFTADVLLQMGLHPGEAVLVAFLSNDGQENTFAEFVVYPAIGGNDEDANHVFIPQKLLQEAAIQASSDINIVCSDGALVIYSTESYDSSDLMNILEKLQLSNQYLANKATEYLVDIEPVTKD